MKKPYLNLDQRLFLHMQRKGRKTLFGACLEFNLAWAHLIRDINRTFAIIGRVRTIRND